MTVSKLKKYIIATFLASLFLFAGIYLFFSIESAANTMNVEYSKNMGWEVSPSPTSINHFKIPQNFDSVYETYNSLQKISGFNLENFKGKSVTRYTYRLLNHQMSDTMNVFLGIIVFENRIIAADIYSTDMEGFLHGICEFSKIKNY